MKMPSSGVPARLQDRRLRLLRGDGGDLGAQRLALGFQRGARRPGGAEPLEQRLERGLGVAQQAGGVRVIASDLLWVHVELDDALARLERHQREATPDGQDHVGGVEVPVQRRLAPEGGAEGEVVRIAHRALALGRLDDARLQVFGDGGQRGIGAREMDAAARVDHGVLGSQQRLGDAVDVAGGRGGAVELGGG